MLTAKLLFFTAIFATQAVAESHPSWWMYASPEATALVGIRWSNLRQSPFASVVEADLSSGGPLAFPDLDCLKQAREIVISSPPLLAAEAGSFPGPTVKKEAQKLGLLRVLYRGVTLWLPTQADKLGVAQISEQLLLVGDRNTLQGAVDRSLQETGRMYSSLLPRAARFSQTGDLWVVAVQLPDALASLFVPLDAEVADFLGQISIRDGLSMEASFDSGSARAAAAFARKLQDDAPSLPAVARGLQASADQGRVTIGLQVSQDRLMAALHPAAPATVVPAPVQTVPVEVPAPTQIASVKSAPEPSPSVMPFAVPTAAAQASPPEPPVTFQVTHMEVSGPQIVRIFGLDEGVREIVIHP